VCGHRAEGKKPPDKCPVCAAPAWRFILEEPLPPALEETLRMAFAGEAKAAARNRAFAKKARQEGHPAVARLFEAVSRAESVHAAEYLQYLEGVVGDTEHNLQAAFENELKAKGDIYPQLIKQAMELGREDLFWSFNRARDVEERHAGLYKRALSALAGDQELDYHVCEVCGYVFDGPPPDACPVCGSGPDQFSKVR